MTYGVHLILQAPCFANSRACLPKWHSSVCLSRWRLSTLVPNVHRAPHVYGGRITEFAEAQGFRALSRIVTLPSIRARDFSILLGTSTVALPTAMKGYFKLYKVDTRPLSQV